MKSNHDIDKLFSQKLNSLESAPSMDAWLKLEKNLQEKRKSKKGIIWFPYAAAAAIALLIVSVWMVNGWEKSDKGNIANVSGQTPKNQQAAKPESSENKPAESSGTIVQPQKKETLVTIEQANTGTAAKRMVKKTPVIERQKDIPATQVNTIRDTAPKVIEVEEKLALQAPAVNDTKLPQQPSVVVIVQVDASEKQAFIAEMNHEGDEMDEPNKPTRAGKLLAKLKKIKKAEFNELGIRPESVVAFVKDKTGKH